jgi:glycosyltransferase involved in cell wall biosynthesis
MDVALIGTPLSNGFRHRFELVAGTAPTYLFIAELRRMPLMKLLQKFLGLHATRLFIPLEDQNSRTFMPLFYGLATFGSVRQIVVVHPDLVCETVPKWRTAWSVAGIVRASLDGLVQKHVFQRSLHALARLPRMAVSRPGPGRVLYLRTNMSASVKAGGMVGHVAGVVNELTRRGYPVDFLSTDGPLMANPSVQFYPVQPLTTYGLPYETNLFRFQHRFLHQARVMTSAANYSFIYQRMSVANFAGVVLSREQRVPLVLEYNGSEAWVSTNWGTRFHYQDLVVSAEQTNLKHAHVIVTVSEVLRNELIERGVEAHRIAVHPNCIDPNVFDPTRFSRKHVLALRARLGISADAVVVGFVGTFGQWHGVDVLARAIRQLVLENVSILHKHRAHFLLVGDGLLLPVVKEILAHESCKPFYTITGLVPQDEAPLYMATMDLVLSPHVGNPDGSRFFGSPTKLFEYMAMGKPIVASDLEQIGKVLHRSLRTETLPARPPNATDKQLAVLARPGQLDQLIDGIRFLLESPQWRAVLGQNARREALTQYTWDLHVDAILRACRGAANVP